ncbi:Phase 1-I flagellin [Anaerohalosphaera lusitana]|uniref:Flagellin n=1 Tax=Anaerohalosphaera lusitana TaxID=1936003 RepID=A0A1U9NGS9_9BACT|nr:flagellin [Anaerohalosphaera lusitana]AQT66958.1 Phase 1-I flagellin [Anaerohalosphaera lusitana]
MLTIKNNLMSTNAARHLGSSYSALSESVERLSSGLRINSAKDDAAGMAVRELMRADIAVLRQASRNAQDGISLLQTMEGALSVMDGVLIRMKELAEQAATGSYSQDQRKIMHAEFTEMVEEIDRIANTHAINGIEMLNTADGSINIHIGTAETIAIDKSNMTSSGLGVSIGNSGYQAVSDHGVDSAGDTWLTVDDGGNGENLTLDIQFTDTTNGNESAVSVDFAGAGGGANYSLTQVVDAINAQAGFTMASVTTDSATGKQHLKVASEGSTADGVTITASTGANTTGAGGLAVGAGVTDAGVTEADGANGTDDGRMRTMEGAGINILDTASAEDALSVVGSAIHAKDTVRASLGYKMNRLESTRAVLDIQSENLLTAESRISDVDVATEMAKMTRNQVLAQAGIAMLSQANGMPQMALSLLGR